MTCEIKVNAMLSKPFKAEAQFGKIVEVPVGADKYEGEYTVEPQTTPVVLNTKDKLMEEDLTVKGTAIDWDFILYPINDEKLFNAKHIECVAGTTLILEYKGRGRVLAIYGKGNPCTIDGKTLRYIVCGSSSDVYNNLDYNFEVTRQTVVIPFDAQGTNKVVLAGYEWSRDGTHSEGGSYQFRGEYMKVKIIPPNND